MSKPNEALLLFPFVFLLIFTSLFSPILAASSESPSGKKNLNRPDPLRGLKYYHGGYNVQDKHYWASAAFTGVHGYAIAGGWMLCGLGFGIFLVLKPHFNSSYPITDHPNHQYLLMFFAVLLFICLAIVATGLVLASNQQSYQRLKKLMGAIIGIGEDAGRRIREVTRSLKVMQELLLPYDANKSQMLNETTYQLGKESRRIEDFIYKKGHAINKDIKTSYVMQVVIVSANLVLLFAALGMLLLHWHLGLITVIFLCWMVTSLCWVLTGIDFFLLTFAQDTCSAFADFEQNPQNNSLTSILPCRSDSNKFLTEIGSAVHRFITEVNTKLVDTSGFLKLCNPFTGPPNYSYVPQKCPMNEVPIGKLPFVLSKFICYKDNSTKTCMTEGKFLPEESYDMAKAYCRSIADLLDLYPDLQNLLECSFIKDAISNDILHQCRPLKASLKLLWSSVLCLSIFMVILVLNLVVKAYQDRGKCFSRFSLLPTTT